jgi:hypothetical protein
MFLFSETMAALSAHKRYTVSVRRSLRMALIISLTICISGGLADGITGAVLGMYVGIVAIFIRQIQYAVMRMILVRDNLIPWRYARFFDYCADRVFLRKVGSGYIFVHRTLLDYFAELWKDGAARAPRP